LAAHGSAAGRSKVELPLEYDGAPIEIAFDPFFLIDMLKVLGPDDPLVLELTDGNKPALFKSGSDYQYLVMPLS
jgi:DNA polymerase-3 subunit beta